MLSAPIAVFFALKNESGYFEDRLENAERIHAHGFRLVSGTLNGLPFLSVATGMGIQNAQSVVATVCRTHQPRLIVSAGFAGGLAPSLPRGGIFLADELLPEPVLVGGGGGKSGESAGRETSEKDESRENSRETEGEGDRFVSEDGAVEEDGDGRDAELRLAESARLSIVHRLTAEDFPKEIRSCCQIGGRLLTLSQTAGTPEFKKNLAIRYRAQAVEMESWGVARFCRDWGLPFLSVRAVSDSVDDALPRDVQKLVRQKTAASRAGAAIQLLFQRPGSVKDLYRLYDSSVECALKLADFLTALSQMEKLAFLSENFFPPQEPGKLLERDSVRSRE